MHKKFVCVEGKTGARNVFLPAKLRRKLVAFIRGRPESDWLFPGRGRMHISSSTVYRRVTLLAKRVKLKFFSPHWLRAASAQIALSRGADLIAVSRSLGHTSLQTTIAWYISESAGRPVGSYL